MQALLSTAYFPPISYFQVLRKYSNVYIERNETYTKQSYRNRCIILAANGPLSLTIPVIKPYGNRTLTKDIRIDNSVKWYKEHWRAFESAYRSSAFFEFICDYLIVFYSKKRDFLWDYNLEIIYTILEILELAVSIKETDLYTKEPVGVMDYRNAISPKRKEANNYPKAVQKPYFQVFGDKYGFISDLSILDLICNCGMDSTNYLE